MHVVVLGAGVIGVTTAYYLTERGHRVTVVDRDAVAGSGASGGNGSQLSYSFTDAMASPALLLKLPRLVAGHDPAFHIRPPIDMQLLRWGMTFLRECTSQRYLRNTTTVLQMAMRSAALLATLRARTSLEFAFRKAGKLVMLSTPKALNEAQEMCTLKGQYGSDAQVVSPDEARHIEPALTNMTNKYTGAVYSQNDEVGDCLAFTSRLGQWLVEHRDVAFRMNTSVHGIAIKNNRLVGIETDNGRLKADAAIVCLGAWSPRLLQPLGINSRIYPMRGYSLTLPAGQTPVSVSVTDLGSKMVFSQLGGQIRIAGFADFVGLRTGNDKTRARALLHGARKIAPTFADYDASPANEWGGLRPMTPDSRPLTGPSAIPGLHLNTGHGSLGWTLACVTGHDVAAGITT